MGVFHSKKGKITVEDDSRSDSENTFSCPYSESDLRQDSEDIVIEEPTIEENEHLCLPDVLQGKTDEQLEHILGKSLFSLFSKIGDDQKQDMSFDDFIMWVQINSIYYSDQPKDRRDALMKNLEQRRIPTTLTDFEGIIAGLEMDFEDGTLEKKYNETDVEEEYPVPRIADFKRDTVYDIFEGEHFDYSENHSSDISEGSTKEGSKSKTLSQSFDSGEWGVEMKTRRSEEPDSVGSASPGHKCRYSQSISVSADAVEQKGVKESIDFSGTNLIPPVLDSQATKICIQSRTENLPSRKRHRHRRTESEFIESTDVSIPHRKTKLLDIDARLSNEIDDFNPEDLQRRDRRGTNESSDGSQEILLTPNGKNQSQECSGHRRQESKISVLSRASGSFSCRRNSVMSVLSDISNHQRNVSMELDINPADLDFPDVEVSQTHRCSYSESLHLRCPESMDFTSTDFNGYFDYMNYFSQNLQHENQRKESYASTISELSDREPERKPSDSSIVNLHNMAPLPSKRVRTRKRTSARRSLKNSKQRSNAYVLPDRKRERKSGSKHHRDESLRKMGRTSSLTKPEKSKRESTQKTKKKRKKRVRKLTATRENLRNTRTVKNLLSKFETESKGRY